MKRNVNILQTAIRSGKPMEILAFGLVNACVDTLDA